ncbi:hypothetical protein J6TS2_35710 [Heyndrickxia sporothermodurans]|nr:hypothetical protein J6TS2_35710 [Heyndrickxia sporothermodurans]
MKKALSICAVLLIACILLSGCRWFKNWKEKYIIDARNGIILYGNEKQIQESINKHRNKLVYSKIYKIKMIAFHRKKIMVINENTAKALKDRGLIKSINKRGKVDMDETNQEMNVRKGWLYGKNKFHRLMINGKNISIEYGGNKVIGSARTYADLFLIVDQTEWNAIKGKEKVLGVLEFKKRPYKSMNQYNAEHGQLVKII